MVAEKPTASEAFCKSINVSLLYKGFDNLKIVIWSMTTFEANFGSRGWNISMFASRGLAHYFGGQLTEKTSAYNLFIVSILITICSGTLSKFYIQIYFC